MRFELTILGSNSAVPAYGRHPSAQVLNVREELYLIDCGEGTQLRLAENQIKTGKIEHIFISHLHGDHIFGLVGLLTSYSMGGREKPLHVYGPAGLAAFIHSQLYWSHSHLNYPLHIHRTEPRFKCLVYENRDLWVYSIPLQHSVPTNGYLFIEKERPRHIIPAYIEAYGMGIEQIRAVKKGKDLWLEGGRRIANDLLTEPPPPSRSFAYCSDTRYHPELVEHIKGVDMLFHEATFEQAMEERAAATFHSTTAQAAEIARRAGVRRLIIGHFSARYRDLSPLLEETRRIFKRSTLAIEGKTFNITELER